MTDADRQTLGFQSEVRQLLHLVVHSLYGNREIFLRELISNAADACDRLRFLALSDESLYEGDADLRIRVECDRDAGTVTVRDNGIGMSRQEVIDNIGTIARSGTREFVSRLTGEERQDRELIGQFGVGFYSAFIVADRVTLTTRRAGADPDAAVRWESDGRGEYVVQTVRREPRGTEVVLHLREEAKEFLDAARLRAVVHKYSDHISFPIEMPGDGGGWEKINAATALWKRNRNEITDEEYRELYKHIAHDPQDPLAWVHAQVEGRLEYTLLLYLPAQAPFDLWDPAGRRGVRLYVRRVFVMDAAERLLPRYLRFVRGIVDCDDLPLNVSREILQEHEAIDRIRAASVKKVLGLLEELARDRSQDYERFWDAFGRVLKEGAIEDPANRERLARLLRFSSTRDDRREQRVTLADYVGRMAAGQEHIWYIVADSFETARASPHLEAFRARGVEVLLLWDPVDEWLVAHLPEFEGKALKSVARGALAADALGGSPAEQATAPVVDDPQALTRRLAEALGEAVKEVRVSARLTDSPACLVADEHALGAHMERLLRAAGREVEAARPVLEVNPRHPLLARIAAEDGERFAEWARLLLEQAVLSEGGRLDDPAAFVQRLNRMLVALAS